MISKNSIDRCNLILETLLDHSLIEDWWDSPNRAFNMLTPYEQFQLDEQEVLDYLYKHLHPK